MGFSRFDAEEMQRRANSGMKKNRPLMDDEDAIRAEATNEIGKGGLHEQIEQHCRLQWPLWAIVHGRTDRRSTVTVGAPDFIIGLPSGRTLWIECKSKTGKLKTEQRGFSAILQKLGHEWYEVRSIEQFIAICQRQPPAVGTSGAAGSGSTVSSGGTSPAKVAA